MTTMLTIPEAQLFQQVFGRSVLADEIFPNLDVGSDLHFVVGPNGLRQLAEVTGIDNLAQALRLALTTAYGANPFNTNYGFDGLNALATEPDPQMQQQRIRISVAQTVARDPRVRRVTDVQATRSVVGGAAVLSVVVSFDTTASRNVSLTLSGIPING